MQGDLKDDLGDCVTKTGCINDLMSSSRALTA